MAQRKRVAPPRYDEAFRAGAVRLAVEQGRVRKEVARELGICDDTLKNWLKAAGIQPAVAEANNHDARRIKELEAQLRDARKQITEKDVSKSGYYDFIKRIDKPDRDAALATEIAECQAGCRKTYGYRRVHIWLETKKNWKCDPKTVLRVMNKFNMLSEIRRRRKYNNFGQHLHKYANHLNRDFCAERPNQKWVTDISYIHTGQGVLYLSMIRDLYDNSIVAHRTGTEQSVNLVLNTIRDAKKEAAAAEVQLHSDQGFQYTSHGYFNLTKEYGITPSMSRRGNCLDNAMAENFFSILKTECINRQKIHSFEEAKMLIDDYIWFYNHERVQLKTKLTPLDIRRQFA